MLKWAHLTPRPLLCHESAPPPCFAQNDIRPETKTYFTFRKVVSCLYCNQTQPYAPRARKELTNVLIFLHALSHRYAPQTLCNGSKWALRGGSSSPMQIYAPGAAHLELRQLCGSDHLPISHCCSAGQFTTFPCPLAPNMSAFMCIAINTRVRLIVCRSVSPSTFMLGVRQHSFV